MANYIQDNPSVIVNGFRKSCILQALGKACGSRDSDEEEECIETEDDTTESEIEETKVDDDDAEEEDSDDEDVT